MGSCYGNSEEEVNPIINFFRNAYTNTSEELDLHGLHKDEVVEILDIHLERIKENINAGNLKLNHGKYHAFKVITGKGIHSKGEAVLRPFVKKFLVRSRIA
jgi:DNA-nicking Smr family endonuclease